MGVPGVDPRPAPPAGTCRVSFTGTNNTKPWANVFWLRLTSAGGPNAGDLTAVLTSFLTAWGSNMKAQQNTQVAYGTAQGVWTPTVGSEIVAAVTVTQAGTLVGTALPDAAACYVVDWLIGAYYRGGHPRSYVPGLVTGDIATGTTLSQARVDAVQAGSLAFLGAVNLITSGDITKTELGTVSFQSGKVWRSPPIFRPYLSTKCRQLIGTQRRRIR